MHASPCPECGALDLSTRDTDLTEDDRAAPGTRHHILLNNNEPPVDSDLTLVQSVVSETDTRLACLDDKIAKLRDRLNCLEQERVSLLSYWTRNQAILSPLRRLPPEVLGEIFSWTLPSTEESRDRFSIGDSPWVLTHTSAYWRAVSISTSSLWSRFIFTYSGNCDASTAYPLPSIEAQLQRSQKLQIHFHANSIASGYPWIFELLSQHSSRWEELSLGLTSEIVPLLTTLRGRLQSLKKLWIEWEGPESQTVDSIDFFQTASTLVDASVYNKYRFVHFAFPAHQLTRYQLDGPWDMHRGILKLAPNLVEVRIEISFDVQPWPDSTETLDLLRLRRLYLSHPEVLGYFRVPALEELALKLSKDGQNHDLPTSLHSFLDRSSCLLRRLTLRGYPMAQITAQILRRFPSITELVIVITHRSTSATKEVNSLMTTLTVSSLPENTTVAPQLRLLFFGNTCKAHIDYKVYLDMLKSRWKTEGSALKTAALLTGSNSGPDSSTLRGLHTLRRDGLDLLLMEGRDARNVTRGWTYHRTWHLF
ncbi:hypothetical protein B0H13DRAFT_2093563 [Mycena leptocephala]|nr:hypothetical protein B0H13DRAFT_2093563 [Mycena leptocephala]